MNLSIPLRNQGRHLKKVVTVSKSEVSKLKAQKVKLRDVLSKSKVENSNLNRELSKLKLDKADRNFKRDLAHCKKISFQKSKEIKDLNVLIVSQNGKIAEKDEKIKELADLLAIKNASNEELRTKLDEANFKISENRTIVGQILNEAEIERKNIESVYKAHQIKSLSILEESIQSWHNTEISLRKNISDLNTMTPFFTGRTHLCATNLGLLHFSVRQTYIIFSRRYLLCIFKF